MPLAGKLELPVFDDVQLGRKPERPLDDGAWVALANLCVPCGPGRSVVFVFQGHEEREVIEPWSRAFAKTVEGRAIRA